MAANFEGHNDYEPIASGLLPGRYQSITRAELFAAVTAIQYAVHRRKPFRLWIDNAFVVSFIKRVLRADYIVQVNKPNHDLIYKLQTGLQAASNLFGGDFKVFSHQEVTSSLTPAQAWTARGNHAADTLASHEFSSHHNVMSHELARKLDS